MHKITIFNSESSYFYLTDPKFRDSIRGSLKLFCDSVSLSLILKLLKIPHKRLHGPDFMDHHLKNNSNEKIVVIGGSNKAHSKIKVKYNLNNCLFIDKEIKEESIEELIQDIEEYSPQKIFICLGLRKQEFIANTIWMQLNKKNKYINSFVAGVGAAVDFNGETKRRASLSWRRLGMEWLPRLIREPRMVPRIYRSMLGCFMLLSKSYLFKVDKHVFAEDYYL